MRKFNIQHLLSGTNSEPEQIFGTWVVQGSNVGKNIMVFPIPSAHPTYSRCLSHKLGTQKQDLEGVHNVDIIISIHPIFSKMILPH